MAWDPAAGAMNPRTKQLVQYSTVVVQYITVVVHIQAESNYVRMNAVILIVLKNVRAP